MSRVSDQNRGHCGDDVASRQVGCVSFPSDYPSPHHRVRLCSFTSSHPTAILSVPRVRLGLSSAKSEGTACHQLRGRRRERRKATLSFVSHGDRQRDEWEESRALLPHLNLEDASCLSITRPLQVPL
ncbi:hypothetical protein BLNAU_23058 [Blattamonas nauphoetae]|uniref:Uncharacterized protein n=1 Tax=Blattamonas nauphoetae TaxID=2049346 RepID=A0ABQ9WRA5_9EUKA|nr:hypothetical protein BLNAU_23058 [Blattamonas nauphoetae]